MPLEPEVLTVEALSPPIIPLVGSVVMAWVNSGSWVDGGSHLLGKERVSVRVIHKVHGGYILAEAVHGPYQREWLLAVPVETFCMTEAATLETMLGYSDEEIEALAEKMKRTPRWLRWIFGKVCDFLEWLDRKI